MKAEILKELTEFDELKPGKTLKSDFFMFADIQLYREHFRAWK